MVGLPKRELGSNQIGLGQYNERLILSLVRREPGIAKAELARITKLTPQTISVIVNRFIEDGFIVTGKKQRGKVGKPSVGLLLNPEGAFSIGVKIGRRSLDVILMAFDGTIKQGILLFTISQSRPKRYQRSKKKLQGSRHY